MPTEAQRTRIFLRQIQQRWPDAFCWKVNDATTAGLPDVVMVCRGVVVWLECKIAHDAQAVRRTVRPVQARTLERLHTAGARVWICGFRGPRAVLYHPTTFEPDGDALDVLARLWT